VNLLAFFQVSFESQESTVEVTLLAQLCVLNGTWQGVWSYLQTSQLSQAAHFGNRSAKPYTVMQFVRAFPTKLAAAEYTLTASTHLCFPPL
jgi:hypothetical protein